MVGGLHARLAQRPLMRLAGAHDGLSAILVAQAGFDGIWAGGLGVSTAAGVPDAGVLTMTEMLAAAEQMRRACSLPIIADVDSGFGDLNVVARMVRLYEGAGIDAVCIEDKQHPKRNSFRAGNVLEEPERFARKIAVAKEAQRSEAFVVVARLESMIAGESVDEALARARLYGAAGADALVVHSKREDDAEIAEFAHAWHAAGERIPLIAIPTSYYASSADRLESLGLGAAIYANHAIRASVRAMRDVLSRIHSDGSSERAEDTIVPVSTLFALTNTDALLEDEPAARR